FNETRSVKLHKDLVDADTGKVVAEAGTRLNKRVATKLQESGLKRILYSNEDLVGQYVASDIAISGQKKPVLSIGEEITETDVLSLNKSGIKNVSVLKINEKFSACIRNTVI